MSKSYIDNDCDELVTTGFTWVDAQSMLHIHLPSLEDRLNEVGLTVVKFNIKDEEIK